MQSNWKFLSLDCERCLLRSSGSPDNEHKGYASAAVIYFGKYSKTMVTKRDQEVMCGNNEMLSSGLFTRGK